ncbi:hypothetical protein C0Q70_03858 [Pomacea canaliculata]|uniref:Carboxylesterase type B domain-containing protein n=1 Tax=Pomacea canaliculata TaxID=400727 RepID=A0A2T7PTX6_POMCA|nr:hypothetical protein C0Q70_03858 [Pomacea canaliculata]
MLLYLLVVSVISVTLTRSQNTSTTSTPPVVQTQLGAISGRMLTAKNGRQYEAFRGIPYARPPVGDLRFSKPQPHPAFDQGRFDAGQFGNICWQSASILLQFTESTMSEDCLFLNVFRSSGTSQRNLLPVFVFIHGGAFVWGSSDIYSMGGLVTKGNIIVVTLNYRLGALGFLSTGDPTLPGNYGLWDQHLAIQWVKNNIQAFNGDPDKITIGGESAGSACVAYQTLTPLSRGLFARAILQSGAATSSWALQRKPLDQAQKLALNLTCPSPRSTTSTGDAAIIADFLSCVRRASPQQILLASSQQTTLARALIDYGFIPTVDGEFVRKNPADMLNDNEYLQQIGFYDRDYLSGVVNNEGGTLSTLVLQLTLAHFSVATDIALLDKKQVLDTAGDAGFYVPLIEFARAVARGRSSSRRNLVYLFEHYPTYFSDGYLGTPHSYEMMYEFDIDWFLVNASLWTVDDERLREVFMSVIVDFVKSGVLSITLTHSQNTSTTSPPPVVQTQLGAISGRMLTAKNGRQYEAFRGIPYARPPVGDLRFSKPQPQPAFDQGHFDAGQFGNFCWQPASMLFMYTQSIMSEDCLFLNVFRSSGTSQRNLLPVFVFIHGGAFAYGSSDIYSMGGLVTKGNIIVVTLNYRLGALGFLSTGDPTLPGNYGLWDQHLAIQWVRDNIQAFNGDPDKITIGGESAGSAGVAYQTLTPLSRGLFARAILQSGTATSSWALQRKPLDHAQKLALNLTCPSPRSTTSTGDAAINADFLSCVRRASPQQLLLASSHQTTLARALVDFVFGPTLDGEFVRKTPADMMNDNQYLQQIGFYDRDYLSGCTNNEGGTLPNMVLQLTPNDSVILKPEFYDLDLVPLLIEQKFGNTSAVVEEVVNLWTADDDRLREVFMSVIVDFVKSGNPKSALRSSLQDGWTDFNLIDESYLSIKANSSSIQHHFRPRETSLWLDLLPTLLDPAFNQTNHSTSHVPTLSELIG